MLFHVYGSPVSLPLHSSVIPTLWPSEAPNDRAQQTSKLWKTFSIWPMLVLYSVSLCQKRREIVVLGEKWGSLIPISFPRVYLKPNWESCHRVSGCSLQPSRSSSPIFLIALYSFESITVNKYMGPSFLLFRRTETLKTQCGHAWYQDETISQVGNHNHR